MSIVSDIIGGAVAQHASDSEEEKQKHEEEKRKLEEEEEELNKDPTIVVADCARVSTEGFLF